MVERRNLGSLLEAVRSRVGWSQDDVWLGATTVSFDISVLELFGSLTAGARLVLGGAGLGGEPEELSAVVCSHGCTVVQLTPSSWQLWRRSGAEFPADLKVISGGEPLDRDLADWFVSSRVSAWNLYGPTEATIWSTYHQVGEGGGVVPIGVPLENSLVYVVDGDGRRVPVGVEGELWVGGSGVARGYLNRDELTAERFLENPFGPGRVYRTGDSVRFLPDGSLEYRGRLDDQVKIRGYRIELGEVEAVLANVDGVLEAVAVARSGEDGAARLVGYVVPADVSVASVREALRGVLPEYMVPSVLVPMDSFPLTSNGKVDKQALPDPDPDRPDLGVDYVAPRTDVERVLAEVWAEVLGVDRVGIDDNFFDLGGDSITVVRAVGAIRAKSEHELKPRLLFKHRSIRNLVQAIGSHDA